MNTEVRKQRREEGYVLVGVLVLTLGMLLIGTAFFAVAGYEVRSAQVDAQSQRAFWLAEAGKERALRWMATQMRPPDYDTNIYVGQAGPDGGTYSVKVYVDPAALFSPTKEFVLESVGTMGGIQRRVRQWIAMESFAKYAYFTDDEVGPGGETIWFIGADVLEGPVHTNGIIHIHGRPQFLSEVTSSEDRMIGYQTHNVFGPSGWPVGGNNPYFAEGFELNVPGIPLPTETGDLKAEAQAGGLYLSNSSEIELGVDRNGATRDGWFRYRRIGGGGPNPWADAAVASLPARVIYCENDVNVKGVLDGELTISSRRDINIVDDITYKGSNAAGAPNPGCDDLLGLVAEDDIVFRDMGSATNNLKVNAVLMALDTSIYAEDYDSGSPRGTLTIWGGLIQKYRGAVGQFDGSTGALVHGYAKNYHYDTRVTGRTPPQFPLRGTYTETAWVETWDATAPF